MLAYAAGFFDGEGSISVSTRKHRRIPGRAELMAGITMSQTGDQGKRVLERFASEFGGAITGPVFRKDDGIVHRRPYYAWQVSYAIAREFLIAVLPYLIRNREIAENALLLLGRSRGKGRRLSDEEYEARWLIYLRHKELTTKATKKPRVHTYDLDAAS
jgi:hypothetical protein